MRSSCAHIALLILSRCDLFLCILFLIKRSWWFQCAFFFCHSLVWTVLTEWRACFAQNKFNYTLCTQQRVTENHHHNEGNQQKFQKKNSMHRLIYQQISEWTNERKMDVNIVQREEHYSNWRWTWANRQKERSGRSEQENVMFSLREAFSKCHVAHNEYLIFKFCVLKAHTF